MYWIEVDFANGKTLRKESENLNDTYVVFKRYCCGTPKRQQVQRVKSGYDDQQTFECNHVGDICM